ncbi:type VI secretion system Vgr family protein [Allopusillimonas ginsengisoli]|uniref:type VI secretion system Vgr family protein n=1 Tax=Allopusillimonas ginsengisoli TaxID=453575 RepID=UPI0039C0DB8B
MTESTYDYRLQCDTLQAMVPDQNILVTQWHGTEAVSQLYRFTITVAIPPADLPLEKLLDQPATLQLRHPDGATARWHGIITQAGQHGHDENYDYYQLILEPRMARLGLRQWSDIYLDQQLNDLIVTLLKEAQLTEQYASDNAPYDYRITITDQDLAQMRRPFTCQFEESCLHFLMRKLEFYGVYFWFEQGEDRESIVFCNDASQQPIEAGNAIYYPKGALDPDIRRVVVTRMDRHVAMQPAALSLHALHNYDNTAIDLASTTSVSGVPSGRGDTQSVTDFFSVVDSDSGGGSNGVPGDTLATWRSQELACQTLQIHGEARTPGVLAGHFLAVSAPDLLADASQYYIVHVEHEGIQTLETSPGSDELPYRARFTALPRWRDQTNQSDVVQFRPQRLTPVPRVARLITGFVDMDNEAGPKRYAQPDEQGRYKIRLTFARNNHGAYKNSAWLRQSTQYAAGAPQSELKKAGMHFPLREGTEVLIAFLNEDPDLPVIVGSLPNVEAPSVVSQSNAREHLIRTPGGSGLSIVDGGSGEDEDESQICLSTPMTNAKLTLGTVEPDNGFQLRTDATGEIHAGENLLIEAPGKYKLSTSTDHTVHQVFYGVRASEDLAAVSSVTLGASSTVNAGAKFLGTLGGSFSASLAYTKDFKPSETRAVWNNRYTLGKNFRETLLKVSRTSKASSTTTLEYKVLAYSKCEIESPASVELKSTGATLNVKPSVIDLSTSLGAINFKSTKFLADVSSSIDLKTQASSLELGSGVTVKSTGVLKMSATGVAKMDGNLIQIG